jgi:hypothetical protein
VIHPFQNKKTAEFVDLINSRDNSTKSISSFILVDDDFNRDVGFDSGIFDEVSVYDPDQNAWIPISESRPNKVGGYRVSSAYRNQYVVVTPDDPAENRIRYVSAEFAKFYASAMTAKKPLFSYRKEERLLITPKGASLPGMYGRSAVMASGHLPKLDTSGRYLVYSNITIDAAELLSARLGGQ